MSTDLGVHESVTLDGLLADPARVRGLGPDEALVLLARVEGLAAVLRIAATAPEPASANDDDGPDPLLSVADVARIFGRSVDWVYRQAAPIGKGRRGGRGGNADWAAFTVRDSAGRLLGFNRAGIERYQRGRRR
jgi:hypothetical protein